VSSPCSLGEDHVGIVNLDDTMSELPGVGEGGMSGRNVQRKLGTTRGSLRRSRTAKTSRISCRAVKSRCAHEWGGWGRLSDDGSRQHNSSKSEDPWGSGNPTSWWCTIELTTRHSAGLALDHEVHEGWRQTGGHGVYVGSRLKRPGHPGRHHLKCQPSSRIEENPPYGMIGGIEETSASYEARSAPRSYPTGGGQLPPATRWARGNSRPYRENARRTVKEARLPQSRHGATRAPDTSARRHDKKSDGGGEAGKRSFLMNVRSCASAEKRPGTDYVAEPFLLASKTELTSS
jgi:hypothetical protein